MNRFHLNPGQSVVTTTVPIRKNAALENLIALGALTVHSEPTGGRPATLWSAIAELEDQENEESVAEDEEPAEDE
jgi:hypothetical protein